MHSSQTTSGPISNCSVFFPFLFLCEDTFVEEDEQEDKQEDKQEEGDEQEEGDDDEEGDAEKPLQSSGGGGGFSQDHCS